MKIIQDWVIAEPDITTGSILTGFDEDDLIQTPDNVILSERGIFTGTAATFTITVEAPQVPQDIVLFDFLGNKLDINISYTDTNLEDQTVAFENVRNQDTTPVNEWSTTFRTQTTNEWIDLDHLNSFPNTDEDTEYEIEFVMETIEDEFNDIRGKISDWADSSFNSSAGNIPLGARVVLDDGTDETTHQITQIYGSGTADDSVALTGTVPDSATVEAIYRPISVSKIMVSTNTLEVNNPHWGMSRKRNVIQSSHNMYRGRLIPLNRPGIKYDSYTLTSGFQDEMSQDFIDFLHSDGTSARPMQVISDNDTYEKREWIIFGQFQGLPTETLDARNHRVWAMDITSGII